jgi:hypothetical protein
MLVEMKFLTAMGKIKRERIRNAHIREELSMEDIENKIEGNGLRWFGQVKRTVEHRMLKRLLEVKVSRKKDPGADHERSG